MRAQAATRAVATKAPTVGEYIAYWLDEIVAPNLSPGTYVTYEYVARCYLVPGLGRDGWIAYNLAMFKSGLTR